MTFLLIAVIIAASVVDVRRALERGKREGYLEGLRAVDKRAREQGWRIRSIQHRRGRIISATWDNPVNNDTWVVHF